VHFSEVRLNSTSRVLPVWLMGLSNATLGFSNGILFLVMPQLMAAAHVPEPKIVAITALASTPGFWFVFFSPMLDVRFSRRWYATVLAALSGTAAAVAVLSLHHLQVLQITLIICYAAANLSSSALGGWLSNITPNEQKNPLSKWMNIAVISGAGLTAAAGGEFVRRLPLIPAAILIGTIVFLPAAIFLFIPAPGPDRRLAAESFVQFNREVLSLLRRREVALVLLLFLSPCSTFALTNLLGGLGADFHASARAVSLAGGAGAFVPGLLGCSLFPVIARRLRLRSFYFANGIAGCLFTLSLVILPHTTLTFALALFGEFLFQALSFAIQIGIVFDAIGPDNPLAATTFSFLTAATNIPVAYLIVIDGHAYSVGGIAGMLFTDGAIGILTCTVAAILLAKFDPKAPRASEESMPLPVEES
jgi:MFS transporter, PAT family, beta-lactamase induction signal transducer AmpG